MRVNIGINCDNAAFQDGAREQEIARILRKLADSLDADCTEPLGDLEEIPLHDINGNRVGSLIAIEE